MKITDEEVYFPSVHPLFAFVEGGNPVGSDPRYFQVTDRESNKMCVLSAGSRINPEHFCITARRLHPESLPRIVRIEEGLEDSSVVTIHTQEGFKFYMDRHRKPHSGGYQTSLSLILPDWTRPERGIIRWTYIRRRPTRVGDPEEILLQLSKLKTSRERLERLRRHHNDEDIRSIIESEIELLRRRALLLCQALEIQPTQIVIGEDGSMDLNHVHALVTATLPPHRRDEVLRVESIPLETLAWRRVENADITLTLSEAGATRLTARIQFQERHAQGGAGKMRGFVHDVLGTVPKNIERTIAAKSGALIEQPLDLSLYDPLEDVAGLSDSRNFLYCFSTYCMTLLHLLEGARERLQSILATPTLEDGMAEDGDSPASN